MNDTVNSGLKDGWEVEEINGKKMLCIYAHGERVQMHDLAEFSNSLRAELEVSADQKKNLPIHQTKVVEDFAYFLHNIDFSNLTNKGLPYKFDDPKMREVIDSMIGDRFLLIVKPRQTYISTLLDTYALWMAAFHGKKVTILCHNMHAATAHINRINRISHLKGASQMLKDNQATHGDKFEVYFSNQGRITSTFPNKAIGCGDAQDVVIWDEAAFLNHRESFDIWAATMGSVANKNDWQMILASTPYRKEGVFYEHYRKNLINNINDGNFEIIDSTVARAYKFKKDNLILKFRVPAHSGIDQYEVVCEDDVYSGDEKVLSRFETLKIHERYRGAMDANSTNIDLLVSVKLPQRVFSLNCGYLFNKEKKGIQFSLIKNNGMSMRSVETKLIEIPYGSINYPEERDMPILPERKSSGNDAIDAADMIQDILSSGNYGNKGYERLKNGKLNFDPNRINPIYSEEEHHISYDCKFELPHLEKESSKIVNIRVSGELMSKINERMDELSILTKHDHTISNYIRGLIQKDLD